MEFFYPVTFVKKEHLKKNLPSASIFLASSNEACTSNVVSIRWELKVILVSISFIATVIFDIVYGSWQICNQFSSVFFFIYFMVAGKVSSRKVTPEKFPPGKLSPTENSPSEKFPVRKVPPPRKSLEIYQNPLIHLLGLNFFLP